MKMKKKKLSPIAFLFALALFKKKKIQTPIFAWLGAY